MTEISNFTAQWRRPDGQIRSHHQVMQDMAKKQVVLLGERHDRYDIHRWQLHVCASLLGLRDNLAVGYEMFPRRLQPVLDEWVAGKLDKETFLQKAEWGTVWGFASDLYMPIFDFCREFKVKMLALNCRRDLVTRVGKEGWDAIAEEERDGLTPARSASLAHREHLLRLTNGGPPFMQGKSADSPEFDRFVRAQQTWDRAFACNIANYCAENPQALVIGIIGRGHMEYGHGTPDQLDDLGINNCGVLLTEDMGDKHACPLSVEGKALADAVFGLQTQA
ncbi:ChaN family lipoprotein [Paenochrobactrum pullorum]|uniref:ChaN family lipoprotein n=1 Tax=Paenochrobactrum pullorum TaxID=1324351 RepID=UPI0035BC8316